MKIDLNLQEGVSGDWSVEKFSISEQEAKSFNLYEALHGRRFISSGTYWRLKCQNEVVMSNTPAEITEHENFINYAKGNILIAGLGLGMVIKALLDKPDVTHITVVEKSADVIKLIAPFYSSDKVTIVHEDIFHYRPQCIFDYAWFDIWTYISADNYTDMKRLNRKFAKFVTKIGHWCFMECKLKFLNNAI